MTDQAGPQVDRRIAILNRGDAAVRALHAIHDLRLERGLAITTVALYVEGEHGAPSVLGADESRCLGPATGLDPATGRRRNAYVDLDVLRTALIESRVDAVWVGWGFVSEMAEFADLCAELAISFVGPSSEALRMLGDKAQAKALAEAAGVPVVPWSGSPIEEPHDAADCAEAVGFPLLVKAIAGGGGRGIRRVDTPADLIGAVESASAEAAGAFGDGAVLLERLVRSPRHLEVQVVADRHGTVWTLGVRDCTVQRRRQKVVEEAGCDVVDPALAARLESAAVDLVRKAGYTNLGTVEFILDQESGEFFFMEVNPRLQVEHTVTEAVTCVDLVKLQLDLADGARLEPRAPAVRGYAVEARLTAEDPNDGFRPSPGRLVRLRLPAGPGIRVDSGLEQGSDIPPEFDPLICKVIATGANRAEAAARLRRALADTRIVIDGGASNLGFVQALLATPEYQARDVDTTWLDEATEQLSEAAEHTQAIAVVTAAVELAKGQLRVQQQHLMSTAAQGRPELVAGGAQVVEFAWRGQPFTATVGWRGPGEYAVEIDGHAIDLHLEEPDDRQRVVTVNGRQYELTVSVLGGAVQVDVGGWTHRISSDRGGILRAPTPGVVVAMRVKPGDRVETDQIIAVLESMKLEVAVRADAPGLVRDVVAVSNTQVDAGDPLALVEPDDADKQRSSAGSVLSLAHIAGSAPAATSAADEARRALLGFDPVPGWRSDSLGDRAGRQERPSEEAAAELAVEIELLRLFADVAAITRRTRPSLAAEPVGSTGAQAMLYAFMRRPESSPESLPPDFLELLNRCLARFDVLDLESGPRLWEGLFRLMRATQWLGEVASLLVDMMRRWLDEGLAAEAAAAVGELAEAIGHDVDGRFPAIAHAMRAVTHDAAGAGFSDDVRWAGPDGGMTVPVSFAERTELWRLERFELNVLASANDMVLLEATAREYSGDRRLIVWAEVPPRDAEPGDAVEAQLIRAFALLRLELVRRFESRDELATRVVLYVRDPWDPTDEELSELASRLVATGQGLGLDKILLRIQRHDPTTGELVDRLLHLAEPTDRGAHFGETPPAARPMRPLTKQGARLLRLKRRGLHDPYDVIELLVAPHARVSPFGHGRFEEHDLDAHGDLTPVSRAPRENTAAVVVGLVTNYTEKHPEGMRRVIILSDPSKGMGALAEPECRRILGALDLAERLDLPVEWFAVSAGARVSMTVGTESMDWVASVLRRIVHLTEAGREINVIVAGVTVGAQPYFQAEATMLMHTKGILVMIQGSSMVLTGKDALDFAGGVSAEDNLGIGGFERVMGGNGEAQYWARDLEMAIEILFRHYDHTYVAPLEPGPRGRQTEDSPDRDISMAPHRFGSDFRTVGQIFDDTLNPGRRKPFHMRSVMEAVVDEDCRPLERWGAMTGGEGVIVWDAHLGGYPVSLIGVESHAQPRWGAVAADGPRTWSGATLFPRSSKKMARALNAASANRPAVVLASLAGFDGSPESMRELQLEYGAEIARAVTKFEGPIVFCIVSRNHGGAFVVFSKRLNDQMQSLAVRGAEASVIGGSAAAAVVFAREVEQRTQADPRVEEARRSWARESDSGRVRTAPGLAGIIDQARADARTQLSREYDAIHTVERALTVGSIDRIIRPEELRPELIAAIQRGLGRPPVLHPSPTAETGKATTT